MNLLTSSFGWFGTAQIVKAMKLTFILLTVALLQVSARSVSQTVTFSGRDVTLKKVFSAIEKQTGYVFFYDASLLKESSSVTLSFKNISLEDALNVTFAKQPLTWQMVNKTITIVRKPVTPVTNELNTLFSPPPVDITGRVVNENGDPVVGATVTVKGTNKATSTNELGEFFFKDIDEKAIL